MAIGIGGSSAQAELEKLHDMTQGVQPIRNDEYLDRIARARKLMRDAELRAMILDANSNMLYFTGIAWHRSERFVATIIPAQGEIHYLLPAFERGTFEPMLKIPGRIHVWNEHEDPYQQAVGILHDLGVRDGKVALDETSPLLSYEKLRDHADGLEIASATRVTTACRMKKSCAEIALLQRAKDMTLQVQQAAARVLRDGISTDEVSDFIDKAHRKVGARKGSSFCIVLFGGDTAFPHGVSNPKTLERDDMVLIDTGCQLHGYNSDITRTYVFGNANARQREVWEHEKQAQLRAFETARLGCPIGSVDSAVREYLRTAGYRDDYGLPGLPHRTGHGVGLEIHEHPYLVKDNRAPLEAGMCFSIEPMLCIPGEFGIRHEDHAYMAEDGPRWFTLPAASIDDPFGGA